MTSTSVYSIDAGLPFARELAAGVMKLAASPERLAGGLILLPSRRAASALQAAFLDGVGGTPCYCRACCLSVILAMMMMMVG